MPSAAEDHDAPSAARWDFALAAVLGAALLAVGWVDTRSFLASRHKTPFTFSLNAFPGGMRLGSPGQELFRDPAGNYARLENFLALEHSGGAPYRHNLGPVSSLEIVAVHATRARLSFRFESITSDQGFTVACNGETLERIDPLPPGEIVRVYGLTLHPGPNVVTFVCRRFLHDNAAASDAPPPGESRPVAGTFAALDVLLE